MTKSTGQRRKRNSTYAEVMAFLDTVTTLDPATGCLECSLAQTDGYPRVYWNGRNVGVHRFTYEGHHGPLEPGLFVLHSCDNRRCRNIEHLFPGTHLDNMKDKAAKGRAWRGAKGFPAQHREAHPQSKLTQALADAIRLDPRTQQAIADEYGISRATVSHIKTGRKWT